MTLVGTYVGIAGLILSVVFFFSSQSQISNNPKVMTSSKKDYIHLTGLLDKDEYLDDALFVYPGHSSKEPGLYLKLSSSKEGGLSNQISDPEYIGMSWSEDISMHFDSKNASLVFKSSKEENNFLKEKEVTIKVLKDHLLPALSSYKMKINYKTICDIDYFNGTGVKDGIYFKEVKELPLFVWDASYIPEDCK